MVIQQLFCSFDKNKNNSIYVQGLDCLFYVLTGEINCSLQLDSCSFKTKLNILSIPIWKQECIPPFLVV